MGIWNEYPNTNAHELNLDWIIKKVKELSAEWAQTRSDWMDVQAAWEDMKDYINNYFENLDVQNEINVKLDDMAEQGTLSTLISPFVTSGLPGVVELQLPGVVELQIGNTVAAQLPYVVQVQLPDVVANYAAGQVAAWLAEHVNPETGYVIDDTLTIRGAAADAKATGDAIGELKSNLDYVSFVLPRAYYWAWMIHATGSYDESDFSSDLRYYESEVFDGFPKPVTFEVIGTNDVYIKDNTQSGTSWVKKLTFDVGEKARFIVKDNTGGSTVSQPDASILDTIKVTMSKDTWEYFLENYTCTRTATRSTYGYYYSSNRRGTRMYTESRGGIKYPVYKATKALMRYSPSNNYTVYLFKQTANTFTYETKVVNDVGVVFTITDDFSWSSQSIQVSELTVYFNTEPTTSTFGRRNPYLSNTDFGRTATACAHGDYYYLASDRSDIGLRKIAKSDFSLVSTYPIYTEQLGHANGSNLVGDNWYISDWYDPNTCHVVNLADDTPEIGNDFILPVTAYYPTANRGLIYVASDKLCYTVDWLTDAESDSGKVLFVTWLLSYDSNGNAKWKPCREEYLPIFGLFQDICIANDVLYAPISKDQNPNKYNWCGTYAHNLRTGQDALFTNTERIECESIFEDEGVLKIVLSNGIFCAEMLLTLDWDTIDSISISTVAWNRLHALS